MYVSGSDAVGDSDFAPALHGIILEVSFIPFTILYILDHEVTQNNSSRSRIELNFKRSTFYQGNFVNVPSQGWKRGMDLRYK